MSQELDFTAFSERLRALDEAAARIPEIKRSFLEAQAPRLLSAVRREIGSRLNDRQGRIAGWQQSYFGSRGGYAAVRAVESAAGAVRGSTPGAITNYLESGHAIRSPGGGASRYVPRIQQAYVPGRGFYAAARQQAEAMAGELTEAAARAVAEQIEKGSRNT